MTSTYILGITRKLASGEEAWRACRESSSLSGVTANQSSVDQAYSDFELSASPSLTLYIHWEVGTVREDRGRDEGSIIKAGEVSGSCFDRGG